MLHEQNAHCERIASGPSRPIRLRRLAVAQGSQSPQATVLCVELRGNADTRFDVKARSGGKCARGERTVALPRGLRGPRGPRGATGARGPAGPQVLRHAKAQQVRQVRKAPKGQQARQARQVLPGGTLLRWSPPRAAGGASPAWARSPRTGWSSARSPTPPPRPARCYTRAPMWSVSSCVTSPS